MFLCFLGQILTNQLQFLIKESFAHQYIFLLLPKLNL